MSSLKLWIRDDPEFKEQVRAAEMEAVDAALSAIRYAFGADWRAAEAYLKRTQALYASKDNPSNVIQVLKVEKGTDAEVLKKKLLGDPEKG